MNPVVEVKDLNFGEKGVGGMKEGEGERRER